MAHYVSHPYKCPKCGHIEPAGGSDMDYWKKSPIDSQGNPVCPECWNQFLEGLGATMLCTIDWGWGADYDNYMKRTTVTAEMVTKLRDETDMPLMYCKQALVQAFGDHDKAKEMIRTRRVRG